MEQDNDREFEGHLPKSQTTLNIDSNQLCKALNPRRLESAPLVLATLAVPIVTLFSRCRQEGSASACSIPAKQTDASLFPTLAATHRHVPSSFFSHPQRTILIAENSRRDRGFRLDCSAETFSGENFAQFVGALFPQVGCEAFDARAAALGWSAFSPRRRLVSHQVSVCPALSLLVPGRLPSFHFQASDESVVIRFADLGPTNDPISSHWESVPFVLIERDIFDAPCENLHFVSPDRRNSNPRFTQT